MLIQYCQHIRKQDEPQPVNAEQSLRVNEQVDDGIPSNCTVKIDMKDVLNSTISTPDKSKTCPRLNMGS
jgi:hypothetical protein